MDAAQELADTLARDVLAAMDEMGDERFHIEVAKMLASLSPLMEENFMTAMRVRLAERRGRDFLKRRLEGFRAGKGNEGGAGG